MRTCCINGCEEQVPDKRRNLMCSQCASSLYYWQKRRPAQVLRRRANLTKYKARLEVFFDDDGKKQETKGGKEKETRRPRTGKQPDTRRLN